MKYDGLIFMLLQDYSDQTVIPFFNKTTNSLSFSGYGIRNSLLIFSTINIHKDNSIDTTREQYTLTPAT